MILKKNCKNCSHDVLPIFLYKDTDSAIWKCPECKTIHTIKYLIEEQVKIFLLGNDEKYEELQWGINMAIKHRINSIYGSFANHNVMTSKMREMLFINEKEKLNIDEVKKILRGLLN